MPMGLGAASDKADGGTVGTREIGSRQRRHGGCAQHCETRSVHNCHRNAGGEITHQDQTINVRQSAFAVVGGNADPFRRREGRIGHGSAKRLKEVTWANRHGELRLNVSFPLSMQAEGLCKRLSGGPRLYLECRDVFAGEI